MWSYLRRLRNRVFHLLVPGSHPSTMAGEHRCRSRCGHVSFCDGVSLYVWGGYIMDGNGAMPMPGDHLWIYHKNFDCWKCQKCTGDIPRGTSGASCVLVHPYAYIICGHRAQYHDDRVYRLHLTEFRWELLNLQGDTISARDKFAAWGFDKKIYCFGGYGPDPQTQSGWLFQNGQYVTDQGENNNPWYPYGWNNQLLILDPSTFQWSNPKCSGPVPLPRAAHAAAVLGEKVFIFGGRHQLRRMNDLHCLDLDTLTWSGEITTTGPQPAGRSWHTWSAVSEDKIFLYGGFTQTEVVLDDAWIFTASMSNWTVVVLHSACPRLWHSAVVTKAKDVLIFGGCIANISNNVEAETGFSNRVIKFHLQPSSLKLLCLEHVFHHYKSEDWMYLPEQLQWWLKEKEGVRDRWLALPEQIRLEMGPHSEEAHEHSTKFGLGGGDPGI